MTSRTTSSDRLLEGENPDTAVARDARHWIAVYREMIAFKEDLLGRVSAQIKLLPKAAVQDVMDNDIGLIQDQLGRYRRRLEFWYQRQLSLEGLQIDDEDRTVTFRDRSIGLTKREYQLLVKLVSRSPEFVSPGRLLIEAWHDGHLPEETLRTYIARLRGKLATLGADAQIMNRPRRGYALVFADRDQPPSSAFRGDGRVT